MNEEIYEEPSVSLFRYFWIFHPELDFIIVLKSFFSIGDKKNIFEKKKIKFLPILNLFLLIVLTIALIVTTKRNNSEMKDEIRKLSKDNRIYGILWNETCFLSEKDYLRWKIYFPFRYNNLFSWWNEEIPQYNKVRQYQML